MYRRRASFFFSLAAAAAASRFLLRIEARVRGASSVCSAISSTREAGSRSMTALNGEESARKGWEGSARRRRRHEFLLLAAVVVVERRGLLPSFCSLCSIPNQAPPPRSIKPPRPSPPESHTLPPNLRFTPPALAARSCSRAACEAWEAGSCSWVVRDAAAANGDRLLFAAAVLLDDTLKDDKEENDGVAGLVGHTPLVRIRSLSEATGCEVREAERAGIIPVRARFFRSESAKRREEREKEREREREAMASPPILHRFFFS